MRIAQIIAAAGLTLVCAFAPAHAEKRVALVIGNSKYTNVSPLRNPANDARLIAETLRGLGFTLTGGGAQLDLDKAGLDRAVQAFGADIQSVDVALFYYAGHGVQLRGTNYLVPVDANVVREADADFQMLNVNLVLQQMDPGDRSPTGGTGARLNVVILDACRNNPFGGRSLRSAARGLSVMQAPAGTLISFATQPGNAAEDGNGDHSPFTAALAASMRRPGLGLFEMFNEVGLTVTKATGDTQRPWVSNSPIAGQFYFAGPPAANPPLRETPGGAVVTPAALPQPGEPPTAAKEPEDVSAPTGGQNPPSDIVSTSAGQFGSSLWDHNGSIVYLTAEGARRRFYYAAPRAGLVAVGVRRGTLLFDGRKEGDRYLGVAYLFSPKCGPHAYAVSGPIASDQLTVTLMGQAPRLDRNCDQVGVRNDILVFRYKASTAN